MMLPQTQTSMWRRVAVLALPVALQMVLQSFLGMADVLMVGGLGAEAVAAVGLAAKLHFLMLVTMMGVATACAILVAQYAGAEDARGTERSLAMALLVGVCFMLPFTAVFFSAGGWLGLINPDTQVVALTAEFLWITAPVLLIAQIITVFEAALRAIGNTLVPLAMGAVAALLNILFNYILIFGHWGFPELGVAGAAWGTLLARVLQLLFTLAWLYAVKHEFAPKMKRWWGEVTAPELKRFLWFALPLLVNHIVWAVGNCAYHVASGFAGTDALAVMGVLVPIESLFFSLFVGLANAASVMVGQSLGANRPDAAWQLCRFFNRLTLALVLGMSVVLWLARPWVLQAFAHIDPATIVLLYQTLAVFCLGVWVKVLNMLRILGILRAGGDTHYCLVVDVIVMWVFGVPLYMAGVFFTDWNFAALYALMYIEDALKWLPIRARVKRGVWVKNLT